MFRFIGILKERDEAKHSVKEMCKVLRVSEAGYDRWERTQNSPYTYDDLLVKIRQIRAENKDDGAYRIYLALQLFHGYTGTYDVIRRLCKTHQLMLKKNHHAKGTTKADPAAQASENLIKQDFTATAPNQKWLGDIAEIPTEEGKLYVSSVLDCFDGAIVGCKIKQHQSRTHAAFDDSEGEIRNFKLLLEFLARHL